MENLLHLFSLFGWRDCHGGFLHIDMRNDGGLLYIVGIMFVIVLIKGGSNLWMHVGLR